MPRTQQSSRKSTGGIAPRASFAVNAPISTGAIELARDDGSIGSAGSANGDVSEANEGHEVSISNICLVMLTYFPNSGLLLHLHKWWDSLPMREVHARRLRRSLHSAA
jgi:hypothetical protein